MRVFVSYRREDNPWFAGRLRDRLVETYAGDEVFFDVDDVPLGADFRDVIRSTLREVDVVLAIIGPGWNPQRLASETDFVRVELHEALRQKKRLIPVLIGDTPMPKPEILPTELEEFAYLNATRLRPDPDFANDAAAPDRRPRLEGGSRTWSGVLRGSTRVQRNTRAIRGLDSRGATESAQRPASNASRGCHHVSCTGCTSRRRRSTDLWE